MIHRRPPPEAWNRRNPRNPRNPRSARTARTEYDGADAVARTHQDLRTGGVGGGAIDATLTTTQARDRNGRLTELKDARNNDSTFEYDTLDRRTKLIYPEHPEDPEDPEDPESETHLYTYNQASDLIAETDPKRQRYPTPFLIPPFLIRLEIWGNEDDINLSLQWELLRW